jgi:hypothetical protein
MRGLSPAGGHDGPMTRGQDDPIEVLRRWEQFGAAWQVVHLAGDAVTVALLRCDGGEEVSRFTSSDPGLRAYVDEAGRVGAEGIEPPTTSL